MSMMMRRGMMVPKVPGGLPAEYLAVQYLENPYGPSTANAPYINTGIIPNASMRVVVRGRLIIYPTSLAQMIFGSRTSSSNNRFYAVAWREKYKIGLGASANSDVADASIEQDFTIDFNHDSNHSTTIGEDTLASTVNDTTYNQEMYLFAMNNGGTLDNQRDKLRIYSFTVYNSYTDTNPSMDLVPCIRIADSKPGMYDLVGRTFYTNAGTGEFLTGYIADGLVLQMDGINKGNVSGSWVDQVSGVQFDGVNSPTFGTDYVQCGSSSYLQNTSFNAPDGEEGTIEVALSDFSMATTVVFIGNKAGASTFGLYGTKGAMWSNYHDEPVVLTPNGMKVCSVTDGLCYVDGVQGTFDTTDKRHYSGVNSTNYIGKRSSGSNFTGKIHAIRIYNRQLSANEMLINQRVDNTRFNLGLTI